LKQTAIYLPHDGAPQVLRDFDSGDEALDKVRDVVGGDWEIVRVSYLLLADLCRLLSIDLRDLATGRPDPEGTVAVVLLVNDMGAKMQPPLPVNSVASVLYGGPFWMLRGAVICGHAIVLEIY
jgi:hypothetical protein